MRLELSARSSGAPDQGTGSALPDIFAKVRQMCCHFLCAFLYRESLLRRITRPQTSLMWINQRSCAGQNTGRIAYWLRRDDLACRRPARTDALEHQRLAADATHNSARIDLYPATLLARTSHAGTRGSKLNTSTNNHRSAGLKLQT